MNDGLQKQFEQDARIIEERMPKDMTKEEADKVADKLAAFIKERGYTQAQVARLLNIKDSRLSQCLSKKYKGNLDEFINKAVQWMDSVRRKERQVQGPPFVRTTIAQSIYALIKKTEDFSSSEGRIGIIIGDAGHGKSICLQQYAKANRNTIYAELDDTMRSTTIFAEIAKKLGVDSSGMLAKVTERLIENLQNRHVIIMLDECSSLNVKELNQLRQIIAVKCRCPLILSGNADLLNTIMQPKSRRGCESLDQFTSRLSYILNLDAAAAEKDGGLYTTEDIRKLYQYGGIRLTNDAVKLLQRICRSARTGRVRTCELIIMALHTASEVKDAGCIDAEAILRAIEQMRLPVKVWLPVEIKEPLEEAEEKTAAKAG